jgi:Arc/MetJ-type ribon-helix-helix transcriptional regulator
MLGWNTSRVEGTIEGRRMRTLQITLSKEEAAFIDAEIARGRAQDAEDVLHQALELAMRDLEDEDWKHWQLQQAIAEADEEVERGEFAEESIKEIAQRVLAEFDEKAR